MYRTAETDTTYRDDLRRSLWDRRYRTEGTIWGEAQSHTCRLLSERLNPGSKITELGSGYGRDLAHLLSLGHDARGIEASSEAILLCESRLAEVGYPGRVDRCRIENWMPSDESLDAVLSHRTLHLLPEDTVAAVAGTIARALRPGGVACLSARDRRDFDPSRMRMIGPDVAEYIGTHRAGHRIHFWTPERFRNTFGPLFRRTEFVKIREPESAAFPDSITHCTVMIAFR